MTALDTATHANSRQRADVHPADDAELEAGRLERLRASLAEAGVAGGLFYDPTTIRYATGVSNMQVYGLHNPCRYVFVPTAGDVVLFEFKGCEHLAAGHLGVADVRPAVSWYHFVAGANAPAFAEQWADEITDLLGPGAKDLAVDRLDPLGAEALARRGVWVHDGQRVADRARMVKTAAEIVAIRQAVAAAEEAVAAMAAVLTPGRTEVEVWAELHRANIAGGGEWIETRLLTSGPRTNPWYQEASAKVIEPGELVAFDTDLIGLGGYSVDISRTWVAGDRRPSDAQQRLFDAASVQLADNLALLRPGASFAEISNRAHLPSPEIHSVTNAAVVHGVGLCNEYPLVLNRDHFATAGYDGEVVEGMVLCAEALAAPPGGIEAVKLERQVLITATGAEPLDALPLTPD
ncbi:MAG: Xaa-Pro peptidase family protein [Actinomycetota bacterium]